MSSTEIYGFNANGYAEFIGETPNAFRGAFVVWETLEKKYLEPLPLKNTAGISFTRAVCGEGLDDLWKLPYTDKLSRTEKIVLLSTFDRNIVKSSDVDELISAFNSFDIVFDLPATYTSLAEQAEILENNKNDYIAFGFNQTSVSSAFWIEDRNTCECEYCEHCKEDYYNLNTESQHFDIFDELNKDINNDNQAE